MRRSTPSCEIFLSIPGTLATTSLKYFLILAFAVTATFMCTRPANAIEMFTFYGDGSRVPLPSLETPIQAYPGIPLRSDRLRARRQAAYRVPPQTGMPVGNGRITIRAMPSTGTPPAFEKGVMPAQAPEAIHTPAPTKTRRVRWRRR